MRGNQLCWDSDAAACPTVTAPGSTVKCADTAGTQAHADADTDTDACAARCAHLSFAARTRGSPGTAPQQPGEKHVIAPPVFVFQKMTSATKRQAEDSEQGPGSGPGAGKRLRCFSFPSPRSRCRTGFCHGGRRMRSSSLCFPPMCPISKSNVFLPSSSCNLSDSLSAHAGCPRAQRRVLLRPALLPAPQPWTCPSQPHLAEMVPGPAQEPRAETVRFCPTRTLLPQTPHNLRALTKTPVQTAGHVPFVFGENMSERVLSPSRSSEDMSDSSSDSSDSELSDSQPPHQMAVRHTLWDSAAAYTAACGRRCLLKRVQVFTGEEHESNVVQITCKLFVLEKGTQSWTERGRGVLRLNDLATGTGDTLQSRIVMRHQGSLKVILNTKLWPHTHLRRPARRSLQFSATDLESHAMRVFLVQGGARDVARLFVAIHHRLVALRGAASQHYCTKSEEEEEEEGEGAVTKSCMQTGRPQVCS